MMLDFLALFFVDLTFLKGSRDFLNFLFQKAKALKKPGCNLTKVFMFLGHLPRVAQ